MWTHEGSCWSLPEEGSLRGYGNGLSTCRLIMGLCPGSPSCVCECSVPSRGADPVGVCWSSCRAQHPREPWAPTCQAQGGRVPVLAGLLLVCNAVWGFLICFGSVTPFLPSPHTAAARDPLYFSPASRPRVSSA